MSWYRRGWRGAEGFAILVPKFKAVHLAKPERQTDRRQTVPKFKSARVELIPKVQDQTTTTTTTTNIYRRLPPAGLFQASVC